MKPKCNNCKALLEIKRRNPEVSVKVRRPGRPRAREISVRGKRASF